MFLYFVVGGILVVHQSDVGGLARCLTLPFLVFFLAFKSNQAKSHVKTMTIKCVITLMYKDLRANGAVVIVDFLIFSPVSNMI